MNKAWFAEREIDLPELKVSNAFLGNRKALDEAFDRDGYLFFKGLLDHDAVRHLTKELALEVSRENIRVNSVYPGLMRTAMTAGSLEADPDMVSAIEDNIPMGVMGEASDIAGMNLFLASDASKYITGAEFAVDGGLTAK